MTATQKNEKQKEEAGITFQAPDFEYQPKSSEWYLITIIVALGLIFLALWQNNFLFAVFIIIGELLLISWASKKPEKWEIKINEKEILLKKDKIEKIFNIESEFADFGIRDSSENFKELVLKRKSSFSPFLEIYFPREKEAVIRETISKTLPEAEHPLSFWDSLIKLMKF